MESSIYYAVCERFGFVETYGRFVKIELVNKTPVPCGIAGDIGPSRGRKRSSIQNYYVRFLCMSSPIIISYTYTGCWVYNGSHICSIIGIVGGVQRSGEDISEE